MALFQVSKVTAWTLVGSLFLGVAGVGVSTARNGHFANQAGVIAPELIVAQADAEPIGVIAEESDSVEVVAADVSPKPDEAGEKSEGASKNDVTIDGDTVLSIRDNNISTVAEQPSAELRDGKLSDHPVLKKLDEETTEFSFVETTLDDAIAFLSKLHGLSIDIDEDAILRDFKDVDHDTHWQVNLELSGVKLRSALKVLLEPLKLDYVVEDDVLRITSQQAAENFYEMRIYQIHPQEHWASIADEEVTKIEALIKDSIGGKWKNPGSDGPGGSIQWTPAGLAVRQTQRRLLAVERLLAQLEKTSAETASKEAKPTEPGAKKAVPDVSGVVTNVDPATSIVRLSVGSDDGLRPQMRVSVVSGDGDAAKSKGTLEIVRVEAATSEARIIENDLQEPIAKGDRFESIQPGHNQTGDPAGKAQPSVPSAAATKPQLSIRKSNATEARIFSKLNEATEVSFVDTSLRDALEYTEDLHNIDILVLETEVTEDGGSIDQQVNLELSNVSLESMLDRLLQPLDLDYVIDDEVMLVTSRTKAAERLELRVYPMKHLAPAWSNIRSDDAAITMKLTNLIMQAVAGKWNPDDPRGGTIGLTPAGLVVRQNQRTHREIENLIEQLRRAEEAK